MKDQLPEVNFSHSARMWLWLKLLLATMVPVARLNRFPCSFFFFWQRSAPIGRQRFSRLCLRVDFFFEGHHKGVQSLQVFQLCGRRVQRRDDSLDRFRQQFGLRCF